MKYLRVFEDINFKKYFIYAPYITSEPNFLIIVEMVDIINNIYYVRFHYSYIYRKNKIEKDDDGKIYEYDYNFFDINKVIFQSDSLEECLEYFEALKNTNIYNI